MCVSSSLLRAENIQHQKNNCGKAWVAYMEKKVTIVIPNYNGKRFLDDCLSSLERQTSKDFETLVIDNASQD